MTSATAEIVAVALAIARGLLPLPAVNAHAQQATAKPPNFEVVSIKPSDPNSRRSFSDQSPGEARWSGFTVQLLIRQAYGKFEFQVLGGPAWIKSDRYDILAKPPADDAALPPDPRQATNEQRRTFTQRRDAMLQEMLADRFRLKIHKESRELPVYVLTVAKGGPKFRTVSDAKLPPGRIRLSSSSIVASRISLGLLVQTLSQMLGRTTLDRTGPKGVYDVELKWTPDQSTTNGPFADAPAPGFEPPPLDATAPNIFTSLQEQLGLKLEASKGPAEVIVIDSVERPTEN